MLNHTKKIKNNQKGFTIIEVLIVLAIAGLILLIVFLAVPALQRNSRNTQRKDDVSRILGAAQEAINNNGGQISGLDQPTLLAAVGTPAYYQTTAITVSGTALGGGTATGSNADAVAVYKGAKCSDAKTATGGTARQIAVVYAIESSGGVISQCTGS